RQRGLDQPEERIDVRLHRSIEFGLVDLFNRGFPVLMRGVADEDIELAKLVHRALDDVSAELLAGQVAFDDDAFSAETFDDGAGFSGVALLCWQRRDGHIRALAREHHGDGAPDARVAAGDERGLPASLSAGLYFGASYFGRGRRSASMPG